MSGGFGPPSPLSYPWVVPLSGAGVPEERGLTPTNKTGLTYRQVKTSRPERKRTGLAHAHAQAHAHTHARVGQKCSVLTVPIMGSRLVICQSVAR